MQSDQDRLKQFNSQYRILTVYKNRMKDDNRDICYPLILDNKIVQWLWFNTFCHNGFHIWVEVQSLDSHYLFCDACESCLDIAPTEVKIGDINVE